VRRIDEDIMQIRRLILRMGAMVEDRLESALTALLTRDVELASIVAESDDVIDKLEVDIDLFCTNLIALKQPAAKDLRFVFTAVKITTDLERAGDLIVSISERIKGLCQESPLKPYVDLPRMVEWVKTMIHKSLDAFFEGDVKLAKNVIQDDQIIDDLNIQLFRELLTFMMENPKNIKKSLFLSFISKSLERIGDHATNIAEMVIFMVEGTDVRHKTS